MLRQLTWVFLSLFVCGAIAQERSYRRLEGRAPVSREERKALEAQGWRFVEPLQGGAWLVSVPQAQAAGLPAEDPRAKLGPELAEPEAPSWARLEINGQIWVEAQVLLYADADAAAAETALRKLGVAGLLREPGSPVLLARIPWDRVAKVAALDAVHYVEAIPGPPRALSNAVSSQMLKATEIQTGGLNFTGQGVRVGVFDLGRIDAHPEFRDRLTVVDNTFSSEHATHVAGTVAAGGNTDPRLKGVAPAAELVSYTVSSTSIMSKFRSSVTDQRVAVATNSWGRPGACSLYGSYGVEERDIDAVVREGLSVVFAIGNDRDVEVCGIEGRGGFLSVSRPSAAKNVITVGALEERRAISEFSSFGPARDGRLKPDVVALGVGVRSTVLGGRADTFDGTSMAAPAVSGLLADLIQAFREQKGGDSPAPELLKAILLNTAADIGNPGPDYSFGYGIPDAVEAVKTISETRYFTGELNEGGTGAHSIQVPAGAEALRVMLAYSDLPGSPTARAALVNDLDLIVKGPDGTEVLPLTLDPNNPADDARPGVNPRDPMEQVLVRNPAGGTWTVEVRGRSLASSQRYALAWTAAPSPVPPCATTVVPATMLLDEKAGSRALRVTRATTCGAWKPERSGDWLTLIAPAEVTGSAVLKTVFDANAGSAPREATVKIGDADFRITQNAPCQAANLEPASVMQAQLTRADCITPEGTFAKSYKFRAEAGQGVVVELSSIAFDTWLELYGPGGVLVAINDDDGLTTDSRIPPGRGSLILPFTGEYQILATSYDPDTIGPFSLLYALTRTEPAANAPNPIPVTECPSTRTAELRSDAATNGRRGDLNYTDRYVVFLREGQTFVAEVTDASFDTHLTFIGGGSLLAQNDDFGGSTKSRISAVAPATSYYFVELTSFGPQVTGSYTLSFGGCSAPQ